MPADIERGSSAKTMPLPAIRPPQYGSWRDFQQAWFWNLLWASLKHGGYLPAGSDLWQTAGALTRARWDANRVAVLAAFGCTAPDADGRFCIYYPPLLEILNAQQKKYRRKFHSTLSETSTGSHSEGEGSSPSAFLSFDFDLDSKNQDQNQYSTFGKKHAGSVTLMGDERNTLEGTHRGGDSDALNGARRILDILGLGDGLLSSATAAVVAELKQTKLSLDGVVQRITTAANLAARRGVSREEFLEDYLAQTSARKILETLNLPITNNVLFRVAAVVKAEAKDTGLALEETAIRITQAATEDRRRGSSINVFYFEDLKWRSNAGTNKAEQRKLNNLEVNARVKQRLREKLGAS